MTAERLDPTAHMSTRYLPRIESMLQQHRRQSMQLPGTGIHSDPRYTVSLTMPEAEPQTHKLFCYGTLMVPAILTRVIGRKGEDLEFQDALVKGYTRHHVKDEDYPGLTAAKHMDHVADDDTTRGTLISGLNEKDIRLLDIFEGDEYTRSKVEITTLSKPCKMDALPASMTDPTQRSEAKEIGTTPAEAYIWTASLSRLDQKAWNFEDFLKEKSKAWANASHEYAMVDAQRFDRDKDGVLGRYVDGFPDFGHNMKKYWGFAPTYVNVNHGSYGSPPLVLVEAKTKLAAEMEKRIDVWLRRRMEPQVLEARKALAPFLNAELDEVVLVPNTTHGINTIAANIDWEDGDIIVVYASTYGAVSQMMKHLCDRYPKIRLEVVICTFPCLHADIVAQTEKVLAKHNKPAADTSNEKTPSAQGVSSDERVRMVVVDSIASVPGVLFPWEEIVGLCRKYGALSLVDGAHSIGQHKLDLKKSDPDFFVTNCHKWLMTHRGSAAMYVPFRNQRLIRSSFPTGHYYESERYPTEGYDHPWTFWRQYDWNGTADFTSYMTIPVAIQFRKDIGGEDRIQAYNHSLAVSGGKRLAKRWGTSYMENEKNELTVNMVNIQLPLPVSSDPAEVQRVQRFAEDILLENDTMASPYYHNGHFWARFSAQVWVELKDFDFVADVYDNINERVRKGEHNQQLK